MPRNDGAYLERAVEVELKKITREDFHWERRHDAKAARGMFMQQPADFFTCSMDKDYHMYPVFLECKSVQSKTYRLPKFNQHPRMLKWHKAGVTGFVLIHFHLQDELFLVPVTDLEVGKPSWVIDMKYKVASVEEAVRSLL